MGLDINSVQFLIAARKQGVEFGDALMLGRQDLNVYPAKTKEAFAKAGIETNLFAPGAPDSGFAEPIFKALGARNIWSLDASKFEGAQFVHDLNKPIGPDLKERFDLVYDGGTLEHVFNFPVALQNCMEMVRPGGRLFIHTCANSWCGHGFYQFSPELFYNALSEDNGFVVERMVAHVVGPYCRWYEVANPRELRGRVELMSWPPVQLLIRARRVKILPIFATMPQQSDYVPRWTDRAQSGARPETPPVALAASRPALSRVLPGLARLFHVLRIGWSFWYNHSLRNRKNFHPIKKEFGEK
jgi:SAM-dependent methyltransferase